MNFISLFEVYREPGHCIININVLRAHQLYLNSAYFIVINGHLICCNIYEATLRCSVSMEYIIRPAHNAQEISNNGPR